MMTTMTVPRNKGDNSFFSVASKVFSIRSFFLFSLSLSLFRVGTKQLRARWLEAGRKREREREKARKRKQERRKAR